MMKRVTTTLVAVAVLPTVGTANPEPAQQPYTRNVAIVIWNNAEILDWAGPTEVFVAAGFRAQNGNEKAFNVYTVSKTRDAIVSQTVVDVVPDYSIADAPKPDVIVLPGGGTNSILNDEEFLEWATEAARGAEVALSVCTGAFVLGKAGLLDDQDVTTWYGAIDGLEKRFPKARVHRGRRFVDNGHIVTTAGVSAGIDGALHVVARLLGRSVADATAEYMEYRWTPEPYLARNYSILNPSLDANGQRMQQADLQARGGNAEAAIAAYREIVEESPDNSNAWSRMGDLYYKEKEYAHAVKAYERASADQGMRPRALYNAACSAALMDDKVQALEFLRKAVEAGFKSVEHMKMDADLASLREEPEFRQLIDVMTADDDTQVSR